MPVWAPLDRDAWACSVDDGVERGRGETRAGGRRDLRFFLAFAATAIRLDIAEE